MDQFLDSWHSYRFRYCSVNNLGLIILFLCFWGIRKYTSGIEQSLTHLTEQLNDLAESEKETWKENKYL